MHAQFLPDASYKFLKTQGAEIYTFMQTRLITTFIKYKSSLLTYLPTARKIELRVAQKNVLL